MEYLHIGKAQFISRPNRFIARISVGGKDEIAHVKNTGRCKELLVPGADIYVQDCASEKRKTKYDLISVYKGERLINMDSQAPNKVFAEWVRKGKLFPNLTLLRPETTYGNSRFDFYAEAGERKIFIEVKGVTLEENGVASFPDAPTLRGVKHVNELCACKKAGFESYLVFIVQMDNVRYFTPNFRNDPAFATALSTAKATGVEIIALDCTVTEKSITAGQFVEVRL
ncbi:MAG: DNA/RNA nuclease SfsA [Oscillospiraceae bacterium]